MSELTIAERVLLTELAVGTARRLQVILAKSGDQDTDYPEPGYIHYEWTSDFEVACDVLWRLGVAVAAYGDRLVGIAYEQRPEKLAPSAFRFSEPDEIRRKLANGVLPSWVTMNDLLEAYLRVACDYGPNGSWLSSGRVQFRPQPEYAREMEALLASGYVERVGDAVAWTNKIGPMMVASYQWTLDLAPPRPAMVVLPPGTERRVADLLARDQFIAAVALAREETGCSLLEAKNTVEHMRAAGSGD